MAITEWANESVVLPLGEVSPYQQGQPVDPPWSIVASISISCVSITIILLGIFTNLINLIVFKGQGLNDGVTISLFALAMSDGIMSLMLFGIICGAFLKQAYHGHVIDADSFNAVCFGYSRSASYMYSTCVTVYLAVERSICVVLPFKFQTTFTKNVTRAVLIIILMVVLALFTPIYMSLGLSWRFDPRFNITRLLMWRTANFREMAMPYVITGALLIPLSSQVIIGVSTALMIYGLRAASQFKDNVNTGGTEGDANAKGERLQGKERRAVKMMMSLSIVFFLCNLPLVVVSIVQLAVPEFDIKRKFGHEFTTVLAVVYTINGMNASANFFIYYHYSTRFKQVFRKLFCLSQDNQDKT